MVITMAGKSPMVTAITTVRRKLAATAITMMGERLTSGFAKRGMVMTMFTAMTTFTVMRMAMTMATAMFMFTAMATLTITNTGGWRRSGRSLARER